MPGKRKRRSFNHQPKERDLRQDKDQQSQLSSKALSRKSSNLSAKSGEESDDEEYEIDHIVGYKIKDKG